MLKHTLAIVATLLLSCHVGRAQTDFTDYYLLHFSVPDMPAFKALGTEPSNLLRPSDLQKFGAMIAPFYSGGKVSIPQNFAIEAAPWKLMSSDWHIEDYKKKKALYHTGFSLGMVRDSASNASQISIGGRMTFLPRKSDVILQAIEPLNKAGTRLLVALTTLENAYGDTSTKYYATYPEFSEFIRAINLHPERFDRKTLNEWDNLTTALGGASHKIPDSLANVNGLLGLYKQAIADSIIANAAAWNAARYDIAGALLAASPDDMVGNVQFSSFHFWGTGAFRLGKRGQCLLGLNFTAPHAEADSFLYSLSVSSRAYVGTKDFRGFTELQYRYQNYDAFDQSLLINLGAEFRLGDKFWIVGSGGVNNYFQEKGDALSRLVGSLDIRYGFNKRAN